MSYEATTPNLGLPQWVYTDKPQMADFNSAFSAIDGNVVTQSDYAHGVTPLTTGTDEAFILTLDPPLTAYTDGLTLVVNFHARFLAGAQIGGEETTLNINGLGARPIMFQESGTNGHVSAGPHPILYDANTGSWILLDQCISKNGGYVYGDLLPADYGEGLGLYGKLGSPVDKWESVYAEDGIFDSLTAGGSAVWTAASLPVTTYTLTLLDGWSTGTGAGLEATVIGSLLLVTGRVKPPATTVTDTNNLIASLPAGLSLRHSMEGLMCCMGNRDKYGTVQLSGTTIRAFAGEYYDGLYSFTVAVPLN